MKFKKVIGFLFPVSIFCILGCIIIFHSSEDWRVRANNSIMAESFCGIVNTKFIDYKYSASRKFVLENGEAFYIAQSWYRDDFFYERVSLGDKICKDYNSTVVYINTPFGESYQIDLRLNIPDVGSM